jgi:hypothetical protein
MIVFLHWHAENYTINSFIPTFNAKKKFSHSYLRNNAGEKVKKVADLD